MGMECMIKAIKPGGDLNQRSPVLSLEKAWHGLHYLLTGSADEADGPLAFLLQGGQEAGEDDGYGPPRVFAPQDVRALDAALSVISDDDLWARFDPEQMSAAGVYPDCWDESEEDLREEYLSYFQEMKKLIHQAGANGDALVVMLT